MELPVRQLVGLCDGYNFVHFRENLQILSGQTGLVPYHADDGHFLTGGQVGRQTFGFDNIYNRIHRFFRCVGFHYNNHR